MSQAIRIILIFYFFYCAQAQIQIFVNPGENFTCPTTDYSDYSIHASFFSQASMIVDYGGIIFNIAVYGVKSTFSSTTTFLLDDMSIFALSITPTISWYFIAKPLQLLGYDQFELLIISGAIFLLIFLVLTYLLVLYNWPCHKGHPWIKQRKFLFTK